MNRPQKEGMESNRNLTLYKILCTRPTKKFITVGKINSIIL
jgi:hypothetical protein